MSLQRTCLLVARVWGLALNSFSVSVILVTMLIPAAYAELPAPVKESPTSHKTSDAVHHKEVESSANIIARMTGMSITVTRKHWTSGQDAGRDFLVVDRLDPDGPAAQAGLQSGDYLNMVNWDYYQTIDAFAKALASAAPQKAVVLTKRKPGASDHKAVLVVFSDSPPGPMAEITHNPFLQHRKILAETPWQSFSVDGTDWCAANVEVVHAMDIGADDSLISGGNLYRDVFDQITAECPVAKEISILQMSSQLNAPIFISRGRLDKLALYSEGIDGLPQGKTVNQTRSIALAHAPKCDRLASHPSDPMRRFGLEGVALIETSSIQTAFDACVAATEANPDDVLSRFHLGRVLHAEAMYEEALSELRLAAEGGHGGAYALLGEMHLLGEGVAPDPSTARGLFDAARAAGFMLRPAPVPGVIDVSGVPLPDPVEEVFGLSVRMRMAMDPNYKKSGYNVHSAYLDSDLRVYLVEMLEELTRLCRAESSLEELRAARAYSLEDARDIEHALYLYTRYLPEVMPEILERKTERGYRSEGAINGAAALVSRYDCLSPPLRQLIMNTAGMALF